MRVMSKFTLQRYLVGPSKAATAEVQFVSKIRAEHEGLIPAFLSSEAKVITAASKKMTTVLSQQLKNISLAIGRPFGESRESYASVLYGAAEAAETDTQTIYSNALHGESEVLNCTLHSAPRRGCLRRK